MMTLILIKIIVGILIIAGLFFFYFGAPFVLQKIFRFPKQDENPLLTWWGIYLLLIGAYWVGGAVVHLFGF